MSGKKDRYVKEYRGSGSVPPVRQSDIISCLEGLVESGKIEIFLMQINKKKVLLDDENEKITMVRKGATLEFVNDLNADRKYFLIKDIRERVKYTLELWNYEWMIFKKIAGDLDLRQIKEGYGSYLELPKEVVVVDELIIHLDYEDSEISLRRNKCLIDDELFKRIHDFTEVAAKESNILYVTETKVTVC
ncbi:MAG: hypothetical protein ACKKMP_03625 [Candidatus Nealsonbacteria bacterium]